MCKWTSKQSQCAGTTCVQYTAIDDCTRYWILRLYPQKNQQTRHLFLMTLQTTLPFPIRTLQVDNGTEVPLAFALTVPQAGMRLRDIKARCPERNGKVERSHRVEEEALWSRSTFDSVAPAAEALLAWERHYNHERFSMALSGLTPAEKLDTFTAASSPRPSGTASPNPASTLTVATDRRRIAAPEPHVQPAFSHNHDRTRGATS